MRPHEVVDGRYELIRRLGTGGFGTVWEAHDTRMQRPVALKVAQDAGNAQDAERFLGEARTAGGLSHPHIVTVHDYGVASDGDHERLYLVMELIDGEPLDAVLGRGLPPLAQALTWVEQVCDALAAAHGRGVIHRDVKPANILVQADGRTKLVDFGIAKNLTKARGRTDPRIVLGTLAYTAPERFAGISADPRSDLYAVGCLLAELCTGTPPFQSADAAALRQRHIQAPAPPLRELRPDVPAELEALVLQLLAKNPGARPHDAAEVRDRLHALGASVGHGGDVRERGPVREAAGGDPASLLGAATVPPHLAARLAAPEAPGSAQDAPGPAPDAARTKRPRRRRTLVGVVAAATVLLGAVSWLAVDLLSPDGKTTAGSPTTPRPSTSGPAPSPGNTDGKKGDTDDKDKGKDEDREKPGSADSPAQQKPDGDARSTAPDDASTAPSGERPAKSPTPTAPAPDRPEPGDPPADKPAALTGGGQTSGYGDCPEGRACVFEGWDGTGWMGYAPKCGTIEFGALRYMVSSVRTSGNPLTLYDENGKQVGHINGWTSTNLASDQSDRAVTAFVHCP